MECGNSGAPEPSSKRKRPPNAMQASGDERERRKARSEGERAPSPDEASAGHGAMKTTRLRFQAGIVSSANALRPRADESAGGGTCRQGCVHRHVVLEIRRLVRSALHACPVRVSRQGCKDTIRA